MKILLVDDEEQVLKGVSRIIGCEEDEWEVETALSGEEALEILDASPFDAVVSDMRMPGMDGAQLLDLIGQKYPSMLRVVLSGQADRETVLRAVKPMHQYLSKPCEPEKLINVIKQAEIFQETIKSSQVLDAIGRANCLPTFPEVINEINEEFESENGNAKSIGAIISRDPVLSARILQLANSSIFSLRSPIADIDKAVSLVGLDMIRSIAMLQAVYSENQSNDHILSAKSLLDHGFRVAAIAKFIAKIGGFPMETGNVVFCAGLMHDVGKLILLNAFPDKYKCVVDEAKLNEKSLQEIEMETFGASHQGIGGYLFGLWGLPSAVTEAVASHHSFAACAHSNEPATKIVYAANWISHNRDDAELTPLIETALDPSAGQKFADLIMEWKQSHLNADAGE